jgi:hypothetical protein
MVAGISLAGCSSDDSQQWLMIAFAKQMNPTTITALYAVSTGRIFESAGDCGSAMAKLAQDRTSATLIPHEGRETLIEYDCIQIR